MKQFQVETRGVRKGSEDYENIRNKIYGDLRQQKLKEETQMKEKYGHSNAISKEFKVGFDNFFCLLIVVPEEVPCYEAVNLLNYFSFPVTLEEDNHKGVVKKEMGFQKED